MQNTHACYPQGKWPTLRMAVHGRELSILATEQFKRKHHKYFDAKYVAAFSRRAEVRCDLTNRQTDGHGNYVTLDAHARRGFIKKERI